MFDRARIAAAFCRFQIGGGRFRMLLAWHHFQFHIPPTWEVTAFKKSAQDGQLAVSDRYGETMSVFWKRMKTEPAVTRRLVELVQANQDGAADDAAVRRGIREIGGWQAF